MTEDDYAKSNIDIFTTHTTVNPDISIDELLTFLKSRKTTGELRILLNQGGRQQTMLTEHAKIKLDDREIIRKILKI